jgi:hypothetical protein
MGTNPAEAPSQRPAAHDQRRPAGAKPMAEHEIHEDHGHSVAAWAGVGIILVGSAVAAWGVAIASTLVFVIGIVICVAGAVAGKVLSLAGYGAKTLDGPDTPDSNKPEYGIK